MLHHLLKKLASLEPLTWKHLYFCLNQPWDHYTLLCWITIPADIIIFLNMRLTCSTMSTSLAGIISIPKCYWPYLAGMLIVAVDTKQVLRYWSKIRTCPWVDQYSISLMGVYHMSIHPHTEQYRSGWSGPASGPKN